MALTKNEKEAQRFILNQINNSLDLLENHLQKFCNDTNGTSIPLVYIKQSIKIIKENIEAGAKKVDDEK